MNLEKNYHTCRQRLIRAYMLNSGIIPYPEVLHTTFNRDQGRL